ncbi:MAG: substrate-binding domain-containing protein [Betaproteobacteria bacterium]|jgi:molybdate transport system substrate-binding protein|nr:substrate-binding domain-containing protein [Betaproteobacteria bacterium]
MKNGIVALAGLFLGLGMAHAAEITVISGGAVEPGLKAAVAAFEKESGHKVKITFNTTPQMRKRVAAGDTFDVIVAPPAAVKEFAAAGKVEAGGVDIGRVGSGVAVRPGAPVPAIATGDDIKKAVLEAESVVFNRASTGIYFENLLKKMGVWEQVEPKTTRYATGAEVMKHALKGKGKEVAFGPITEILLEKDHGLILVGPLPPDVQNYTSYIAVPMSAGTQKDAAQALVKFLGGPAGKPLFVAAGIE